MKNPATVTTRMAPNPQRNALKVLSNDTRERLHDISMSGMERGMHILPIRLLVSSRPGCRIQGVRLATNSPMMYNTAMGLTLSIHVQRRARSITSAGVAKRYIRYGITGLRY